MFPEFDLDKRLLKALDKLGFQQPTPVQTATIPAAMEHKDLLVSAETGSGKTAAFLLPTLHQILIKPAPESASRMLILLPTRELARQVMKHFKQFTEFTHLQFAMICGGEPFKYQRALFRKNPEVIIATPGRLLEHIEHGTPDFSDLEFLILDEADRMLDMGFSEDVLKIVSCCNKIRQTLLFSATLNHRGLSKITDGLLKEPEIIRLNTVRDQHSSISQQIVLADDALHKGRLTAWLLANETFDKALVFTNTRAQADKMGGYLRSQAVRVGVLHGEMDQEDRNRIMQLLRQGIINVLVATDVAARGLDVKGIDLVINFDMARSGKEHVHRIGRTGRAGEKGLAICLVSPQEWNLMSSIGRYLRVDFEQRTVQPLLGKYKGPKKTKGSSKAASSKKVKQKKKDKADKSKQRHRNKKNIGKRRAPSAKHSDEPPIPGGFKPLTKKTK
ncbi:ATP-dependent RNA helicase SrmB [hydrothermal vent metagenome]|uniref:ATP-dependent RNA helicase SrmB n=1 Tax=hydrothermal vent metagenome TaxID=652676 RepID=A0A3B1B949_9ZZZZ